MRVVSCRHRVKRNDPRLNHHDAGYKELFSYPEFVQQLIEGFAPANITELLEFQSAVDSIVAITQACWNKERIDKIITR